MKTIIFICLITLISLNSKSQDITYPKDELTPKVEQGSSDALQSITGKDHDGGKIYSNSNYKRTKDKLRKTFTISVDKTGTYYLAAHVLAVNEVPVSESIPQKDQKKLYPLQQISVYIDGQYLGELDIKKNGWQPAKVKGSKQLPLSTGKHEIAFESNAPFYPEIDVVKLAAEENKASFDMTKYQNYVAELKQNMEKNKGRKDKIRVDETAPGGSTNGRQSSASNSSSDWEVSPYTLSNPSGNYKHKMTVPIVYTYYKKLSLTSGQTVKFNTSPVAGDDYYSVDPVMYLFCDQDINVAWSNDDDIGRHPKIQVTIPRTGDYYLVLRAYSNYHATTSQGSQGVVNVYQNGFLLQSDAPVSGYMVDVGTSNTGLLNYFTGYSTGTPKLWLAPDGRLAPIKFHGSTYWYVSPMDYNWFDDARFRIVKNTSSYQSMNLLVSSQGAWWVYWGNCDVYGSAKQASSQAANFFPNLKINDAIQSAPSTNTYNCAAWAGGLTNGWFWGCLYANSSGGSCVNLNYGSALSWSTWDNFFGNNPARYNGAITYTRDQANSSNAEIDLWSTNGNVIGITHLSARREANRHPHGYDWESKPGGLERMFHPRNALNGPSYGQIFGYYRDAAKDPYGGRTAFSPNSESRENSVFTFEESVELGLTVVQKVELTNEETEQLSQLNNKYKSSQTKLDKLYFNWLKKINSEEFKIYSNPAVFFDVEECLELIDFCQSNEEVAVSYLMDKIIQEEENSFQTQMTTMLFCGVTDEKYGALMEEVKEEWKQSNFTQRGAYIAPSAIANTKNYIKKVLNDKPASLLKQSQSADQFGVLNNDEYFMVYPNPISDVSRISIRIDNTATISLKLYDVNGQMIKDLADDTSLNEGVYKFEISKSGLKPGLYVCRLQVDGQTLNRKILIR